MKKRNKRRMIIAYVTIGFLAISGWAFARALPYPTPSGSFKVGTIKLDITDPSRMEKGNSNEAIPRTFIARIWYPASPSGKESMLPTMEKPYADGMQKLYGFPSGKETPSHSHIDAPITNGKDKFPILIFTHGVGSYMTQNLTSFEDLASQGYIVLSLSFPGESVASIYANGKTVEMENLDAFKEGMQQLMKDKEFIARFVANTEEMKNPNTEIASTASKALGKQYNLLYPGMKEWLATRVEDNAYLIDNLGSIKIGAKSLNEVADLDNIGLFGHSFGGLTTLQFLMNHDAPSVKCGIALDVPYFTLDTTSSLKLNAPVLFMSSEFIKLKREKVQLSGINDFLKAYTDKELHEVNVIGAAHYNFSDLNYAPKFLKLTPMLGKIPQKEAAHIMKFYTESYFDIHLKGANKDTLKETISERALLREI